MRVSVVIASLLRGSLERAVQSIRAQSIAGSIELDIVVGVDANASCDGISEKLGVRVARSNGRSQALALNAAAKTADGDYLAFLEDDDRWAPAFLETALTGLDRSASEFISSTTLQLTESEEILCIGDFPIPSGWVMKRSVWDAVGGFDESYRWHLDNEWLGRLTRQKIVRAHLMEATAPITMRAAMNVRPQIAAIMRHAGPALRLVRHNSPFPLVYRHVHPVSGMAQIAMDPGAAQQREREYQRLCEQFGTIPW